MAISLTYADVPKDIIKNLQYRAAIISLGDSQPAARPAILEAASNDFLWWLNTFCFIFEPRPPTDGEDDAPSVINGKIRPFVTWKHQDVAYKEMAKAWGRRDIGIIKSRAEGASWIILMMMVHGWRFGEMEAYGVASRNIHMVDNPRDPNSLLWKVQWALKKLPTWMISPDDYERNITEHAFLYKPTGSTIVGNTSTGDLARGGRATVFLMDEFAAFEQPDDVRALDSTRDVSNCRIFLSTPQGPIGAYYEIMTKPSNMLKLGLWWHENEIKNPGLYRVHDHKVSLVDVNYWKLRSGLKTDEECHAAAKTVEHLDPNNVFRYGFMTQGEFIKPDGPRSPWYDGQCQRAGATPRSIAQELDGDFGGSMERFFDNVALTQKLIDENKSPLFKGDFHGEYLEPKRGKPVEGGKGYFHIYSSFLLGQRIPIQEHEYAIGVDIAAGNSGHGGSNSVIAIVDAHTKELCAEYTAPNIPPHELAELAFCLGHFYRGEHGFPVIIPETNGIGSMFLERLKVIGYPRIYVRKVEDRISRRATKTLGFHSTPVSKKNLLGEFRRALYARELICHSSACLEETKQYMLMANGAIEHVGAAHSEDPSGAKSNHGDRVIAVACAWKAASELRREKLVKGDKPASNESILSIAGRMQRREEKREQETSNLW